MHDGGTLAAGPGVDGETSGLVDHQQIRILVQHRKVEPHRIEPRRRDLGQAEADLRSGARPIRRCRRRAIHIDETGNDELLHP